MPEKTLILTHPLTGNYGGLLQAYASYTVLESLELNPYIYKYIPNDLPLTLHARLKYLKNHIRYILKRHPHADTRWRRLYIAGKFLKDLRMHKESSPPPQSNDISYFVGSDQVWRAIFCRLMKSPAYYFLNFATKEQRCNSIAYAASFGTDEWEGTPEETEICKQLIKDFKAISVREHSGIDICRNVFDKEAVQMPDPTLLLEKQEYEKIIHKERTWAPEKPYITTYILDRTSTTENLAQECALQLHLYLQHLTPSSTAPKLRDRFAPTVPQWLRLIHDSKYFITDSFHGCAFAIIFNKPFVCLGNPSRGSARFDSLLKTFGLQNRLVANRDVDTILQTLNTPIDWVRVNSIREQERARGIEFLAKNLLTE